MSDAKHTPGPWSVPHFALKDSACQCQYVLCNSLMGSIAVVNHQKEPQDGAFDSDNPPMEEAIANARLIAAAPDLLAACKAACDHLDGCSHGYPDSLWDSLQDAIAKAEKGVSP